MMRMLAWWGTTRAMSSARHAGLLHRLLGRVDHDPHGPAEDLLAVHVDAARRPRRRGASSAVAVGVEVPAEQLAAALDRLEHDGAGAVGEQDGGVAVVPVGDARERVGADDEDFSAPMAIRPWADDQRVREPGARGVDVERAAAQAERVLRPSPRWPARCGRASSWRAPAPSICSRVEAGQLDGLAPGLDRQRRGRARRRGARGCRCARRSTRRWCRGRWPARSSLVTTFVGQGGAPSGDDGASCAGRDGGHGLPPYVVGVSACAARRSAGGR